MHDSYRKHLVAGMLSLEVFPMVSRVAGSLQKEKGLVDCNSSDDCRNMPRMFDENLIGMERYS